MIADGVVSPLCFVEKTLADEVHFEEIGHSTPVDLPDIVRERALACVGAAVAASGVRTCVAHAELRITRDDCPILIELGARLAGDRIPFMVRRATGVCPFECALVLAAGGVPEVRPREPLTPAGVRFFHDAGQLDAARLAARSRSSVWSEHLAA